MSSADNLKEFQKKIGYTFKDDSILRTAFTHSSYANEHAEEGEIKDYERLEFLGDAVLEVVSSDYLFHRYKDLEEGELTKKRASMVCEPALAYCAAGISLGDHLLLGKGEEAAGGRTRDAILADVMEAVAGAVYLDGGFEAAKKYIISYILESQDGFTVFNDSKTALQELVQGKGQEPPQYRITGFKGPEHRRVFMCEVIIGNKKMGEGEGTSKKGAEQNAARKALDAMREEA